MAFEAWLLFVAVCVAPAFTPRPAVVFAIANTLRYGAAAAFWSSLGNALDMLLVGMAVTLGLGAILAASATVFAGLKIVATLYLVWLGLKIMRDRSPISVEQAPVIPKRALFVQGFVVSVTNPKAVMLFMALLPPFMSAEGSPVAQGFVMSATLAAVTVVSHRGYALALGRTRHLLACQRRLVWTRRALGGSLIGFGAGLAVLNRP